MAIQNWPKTATSSDWTSVDGIVWPEGQAPGTVNDSGRAMGRDLAKWRDDINSTITSTGSSNAYVIASNGSYTSLANGFQLSFKANFSNTGAATLNVDTLGAKAIRKFTASGEAALAANDIVSGGYYWVQYNTAANSAAGGWILLNASSLDGANLAALSVPTAAIANSAVSTAKIADDGVTYAKIQNVSATNRILARYSSGAGDVEEATLGANMSFSGGALLHQSILGTPVAATSGTSIDFTSIPSWVRCIDISLVGVSTNGTTAVGVQIGDSGGIETSGYSGTVFDDGTAANFSGGWFDNSASAAIVRHGIFMLRLVDSSTFTWSCTFTLGYSNAASGRTGGGTKSLSAALDRVRVTSSGGADTFDAGSVNIVYW